MPLPEFEKAKEHIFFRLETELSPLLSYHNPAHTRDDVLPATIRLAEMEHIQGEDLLLLMTAACYHDTGYFEQYSINEGIAARIAADTLPGFGYSPGQVQAITGIILATRMPQTPHNLLEQVMADADLDSLGRPDYWELRVALRREYELFLGPVSDPAWLRSQLEFIRSHHYFTPSARVLREEKKQDHILELLDLIKRI
jgi:uncharacterized protein